MTAISDGPAARVGIRRDAATWFAYLLLGYFTYLNTSQGNVLPFLRAELGLSYAVASLHASAIAVGMLIVGLWGDRVIVRFGRRRLLIFGALASAFFLAILGVAPSVQVTVASCLLMGLTGAFIAAIVSALLSDIHGARRDIALTEANAVCYLFAIAAPVIAGVAVWAGWSWRIVPFAGVVSAIAIVATFWRATVPDGAPAAAKAGGAKGLPPAYWAYWAMLGFGVGLEFSALLWAPSYLERVVGLPASTAALGAGAFFVAMLLGRTIGIRLVRVYPARSIFFAIAAAAFVGFLAYWLAPRPEVAVAGLFLIGLGVSLLFPITISFAMGAAGAASNRASTRAMLAPGLAILLNPPLLGSIADSAGLWFAQIVMPVFLAFTVGAFLVGQRLEAKD
jgi:fucose permease